MKKKAKKGEGIQKVINNPFKDAIEGTPDISNGYKVGLKAVKNSDAKLMSVSDPQLLNGGVDIDTTTRELYKDASRWDYAIGYNQKVYYVEVHSASSKNIDEVFKKRQWLESWLMNKAQKLNSLPSGNPKFVWIATESGIHLQPNSAQAKKLATMNMRPVKHFILK